MRWDARRKRYVRENDGTDHQGQKRKKIKTESGVWIQASYKSDRYARWRERSKLAQMQEREEEGTVEQGVATKREFRGFVIA